MSPPVSVAMAVYNGRRYLAEQLDSVLSQLEGDDEVVIVDDGSSDGSVAFIEAIGSPRIRLHVNPRNRGVIGTFDRALRLARHDLVFLCDQDDIWLPGKKAAFIEAFAHDERVCVVICDAQVIDGSGKVSSGSYMIGKFRGFDGSILGTLWRSRYLGCAMAVRRSLLRIALPIPSRVPMHDMWLGALGRIFGRVAYLSTPFQQYRRHDSNASPLTSRSLPRILIWRVLLVSLLLLRGSAVLLGLYNRSRPSEESSAQ